MQIKCEMSCFNDGTDRALLATLLGEIPVLLL
jgi:hypothetical protein